MLRKLFFLIIFCSISGHAVACTIPPKGMYLSVEEMVAQSDGIYVGKAVRVDAEIVTFDVLQTLKGAPRSQFQQSTPHGDIPRIDHDDADAKHLSPRFWHDDFSTRDWVLGDCEIARYFVVGMSYLVFTGLETRGSWERIQYIDDEWLRVVRAVVETNEMPSYPLDEIGRNLSGWRLESCNYNSAGEFEEAGRVAQHSQSSSLDWPSEQTRAGKARRLCRDVLGRQLLTVAWMGWQRRGHVFKTLIVSEEGIVDISSSTLRKVYRRDTVPLKAFGVGSDKNLER